MTVRRANGDDARAIARLHVRAWRIAFSDLLDPDVLAGLDVDEQAREWRERMAADGAITWVADQDGFVAGFATVRGPLIVALYVDPRRPGRRRGRHAARPRHRARGPDVLVWEGNGHGRDFYEGQGWELAGPAQEAMGLPTVRYRCSSP